MSKHKITVSADPLLKVLNALTGPPHYIQELIHTRNMPGGNNPIDQLIEEANAEVDRINASVNEQKQNENTDQS